MGVADRFRQLDEAVVPSVGSRLYRLLISRAFRAVAVAGLVALGATVIVALWWTDDRDSTSAEQAAESGSGTLVGPPTGASAEGYIEGAHEELRELVEHSESEGTSASHEWAVVSLEEFMTPGQFDELLQDQLVHHVFVHPPLEELESRSVEIEVAEVPGGLRGALDRLAERRELQAQEKFDLAESLSGDSTSEQMQRERYRSDSQIAFAESQAFNGDCQCVYGAVVHAPPETLAQIEQLTSSRVVHPAPRGAAEESVTFVPLLPASEPATSSQPSSLEERQAD